ncbi:MAG: iron ABC transporter permease [Candidatus Methanomethylophilaceae archaeon]|nr:iron ABC transporter permease [Candidatus Methanomethylophilaceae archaeon]
MRGDEPVRDAVAFWLDGDDEVSNEKHLGEYRRFTLSKILFIFACAIVALLVSGYAISVGEYSISFLDTYIRIWEHVTGNIVDITDDYVVWELRLPRVLGGILAGIALSVCGVSMQSMLKNPLADTYTTGISSGASLGATLAICAGFSLMEGPYAIVINAFLFSLVPMMMILAVSRMNNSSVTTIIMAGIAVMYIFNACNTVLKLWATDEALANVYYWSVGSLTGLSWSDVAVMAVFVVPGVAAIQLVSDKMNKMSMGDENARALGVDVERFRLLCLLVTSLVAASVVCFTGLIGFVGLVCPHIARIFIGSDNRLLIPASASCGAALLLVSDVIGRVVIAPNTLQVGVVTAFIGGPMFLYLVVKNKQTRW